METTETDMEQMPENKGLLFDARIVLRNFFIEHPNKYYYAGSIAHYLKQQRFQITSQKVHVVLADFEGIEIITRGSDRILYGYFPK